MLKIQFKDKRKPAIWLVDSVYKIGKDSQCQILLDEKSIDPLHVKLDVVNDDITLQVISKKNNIFVNEMPVINSQKLKPWDIMRLGETEFEIIDPINERNPKPRHDTSVQATVIRPAITPWMLEAYSAPLKGKYFSISGESLIGRDSACEIQIPLGFISRKHAKLSIRNGRLLIQDLNSSNGTFVNGEKVASKELKGGDELELDKFAFKVVNTQEISSTTGKTGAEKKLSATTKNKEKVSASKSTGKHAATNQRVFFHGISSDVAGKIFEIADNETHVSRLLGHHLSRSEESVSARHVYLKLTDVGWEIKNNGAADGLIINKRMQTQGVLHDEDEVTIGGTKLKFQCNGSQPRRYQTEVQSEPDTNHMILYLSAFVVLATAIFYWLK
ncbi:MAG: FHA domain-containing protein [Gammaproteobacteria bacterium]|nr:FHA domain-containing protein [Gammaproteobacteria bacterium]MDH5628974.1 FHA domain-containing protein [Gammaproteobacteria bacterium]